MSTPYFYIILQKSTNKLYAGSRWSKNCNPDELFKTYFTSSNSIHNIIKKCGKADFQILKIITDFSEQLIKNIINLYPELKNKNPAYIYETYFLRKNNCSQNKKWINKHNNFKNFTAMNKTDCLKKYGCENISQLDSIKMKKEQTFTKHYNKKHYFQTEECKNKFKEKYGVDTAFNCDDIINKIKQNCFDQYNVYHHQSRPEIRNKISQSLKGKEKTKEHLDKIKKAKSGMVHAFDINKNEYCYITKELFDKNKDIYVGRTYGKIPVKDEFGNKFMVEKNNLEFLSGKFQHISKGTANDKIKNTVIAINSTTGEKLGRVSKNDIRWSTGEIISPLKNKNNVNKGSRWMKHSEFKSKQILRMIFKNI